MGSDERFIAFLALLHCRATPVHAVFCYWNRCVFCAAWWTMTAHPFSFITEPANQDRRKF